ncbi:hypothetical protein BX616_004237, partial [Lobosporangium transversale]
MHYTKTRDEPTPIGRLLGSILMVETLFEDSTLLDEVPVFSRVGRTVAVMVRALPMNTVKTLSVSSPLFIIVDFVLGYRQ